MTQPGLPPILLVGADSTLEYLLRRYARQSGCDLKTLPTLPPELNGRDLQPLSVWLPSLEALAAFQPLRASLADEVPIIVCSALADDARATELGADYFFLHPLTYDSF